MGLREPQLCKLPRPHAAASASPLFLLCVQERCACESLDIITRAFIPCVCVSLFSVHKGPLIPFVSPLCAGQGPKCALWSAGGV